MAGNVDRIAKLIYDRTQLVQMDAEDLAWDILSELGIEEES